MPAIYGIVNRLLRLSFRGCISGPMQVLADYLKMAGISQAELAKRAGINPAALNHFMQGRREPRVANLRKLSEATGISIERLVADVK